MREASRDYPPGALIVDIVIESRVYDRYSAIHTDLTTLQGYPKAAAPLEGDSDQPQRFKRLGTTNKPLQHACKLFEFISKSIQIDHKKEC